MKLPFANSIRQAVLTTVLLVWGVGLLTSAAHAEGHPLLEAIENVFKRSQTDDLKEYGLDNSQYAPGKYSYTIKGCWLKKGESKIYNTTLSPDVEYAVIAGGESHAAKIKLVILDPGTKKVTSANDPVITESSEDNNAPGAVFRLKRKQLVGIRVTLDEITEGTDKESAYVAFVLLRKDAGWDVPLENLKSAAEKLQARLDKVREANGGSADLMYGAFSVHGGVIPKGMISDNLHSLAANKKFVFIAASDGNTEALDVTLDGPFRGTNDSETTDDGPKVTYKRGPKGTYTPPYNAKQTVKNNGDTAIVLVAIVELIEAG